MAKVMFRDRVGERFDVSGAGTLVIDGQPMSQRTRNALGLFGLADPDHRSRQLTPSAVRGATLIVAMEPDHIRWARKQLPVALPITATLKRLVRDLPETDGSLDQRVAALGLASVEVGEWEEVIDPGGGDQAIFDACAKELDDLVDGLIEALGQ